MAYVTGTANNITDLRTAIFNACTANGWTLAGEVLYKGTNYVRLQIVSSELTILGGTGKDGSNNLTGAGPAICRVGSLSAPATLAYPMTYHVFINTGPDEVYVVVNFSSIYYEWIAFGQSSLSLPGSGNWYGATLGSTTQYLGLCFISDVDGGYGSMTTGSSCALWWTYIANTPIANQNAFIHHGLDGGGWSSTASPSTVGGSANAISAVAKLVQISPNNWNSESVLIPMPVVVSRGSSVYSVVAQPKHARYCRITNFTDEQVLTIGSDQWKIFPWFTRNTATPNPANNGTLHSGTLGWAVRYTP